MKLVTSSGEVMLPDDFSFEIEVNNPFFSDEGTASVPAVLPGSAGTLDLLGHPERLGKAVRQGRTLPAILQHGVFQRRCKMVLGTVNDEGVAVSLAFSESEMYSEVKDMQLKELFAAKRIELQGCTTVSDLVKVLWDRCYKKEMITGDEEWLRIFPVAVDKKDDGSVTLLNEVTESGFVYASREITVDNNPVTVPEGYGVTPFIVLHNLIDRIFSACGYQVVRNDFTWEPFASIVVLNNCADTLCKGVYIPLKDLVPSCTVGELISWLKDKFGAAITVDNGDISIILVQKALTGKIDEDLTGILSGNISVSYPAPSRVLLECDTSLDSAKPAAETMQEMKILHPKLREIGIDENPRSDGFIFRKEIGKYYVISGYNRESQGYVSKFAGSNCFIYDRKNSEETDKRSADDRFVPEIDYKKKLLVPYIGDKLHYNTAVASDKEEEEQSIQICYAFFDGSQSYWFGNTQPYSRSGFRYSCISSGGVLEDVPSLTPDGLYASCWAAYNLLLLNSAPEVTLQLDYDVAKILSMDLMRPKLLRGQKCLIKSFTFEVSASGIQCGKTVLQLIPDYDDKIQDLPIEFESWTFKWVVENNEWEALRQAYNPASEDYFVISRDGPDYTMSDAPAVKPTKEGQIAKLRNRTVTIGIFDPRIEGEPEHWTEKDVEYEEWFEAVFAG